MNRYARAQRIAEKLSELPEKVMHKGVNYYLSIENTRRSAYVGYVAYGNKEVLMESKCRPGYLDYALGYLVDSLRAFRIEAHFRECQKKQLTR